MAENAVVSSSLRESVCVAQADEWICAAEAE
jgi:hypothetical protein